MAAGMQSSCRTSLGLVSRLLALREPVSPKCNQPAHISRIELSQQGSRPHPISRPRHGGQQLKRQWEKFRSGVRVAADRARTGIEARGRVAQHDSSSTMLGWSSVRSHRRATRVQPNGRDVYTN